MRRSYQDKAVLITGAGGGLGAALCERFAKAGAKVAGIDLDPKGLAATEQRIEAGGSGTFAWAECDVTDDAAVRVAIAGLEEQTGPIAVLVNNAGITHLGNFGAESAAAVSKVMDVNLGGAVSCTAAALDSILAERGQIVAISSVAGFAPLVGRTAYCASKHAMNGFFNTLRTELYGTGADVLLVCPSFIATNIRKDFLEGEAATRKRTVGPDATPEAVAEEIFQAAAAGKREITTGTVGMASKLLWRFVPKLYERLMLRNISPET